MLLDTLTNFFNIEINENKEELMDIAKKNTFLAYTYKLRKSLDITMEQSLSYKKLRAKTHGLAHVVRSS